MREVAFDESACVDRRRAIGITAALVAIAAEDEHSAADERDGPDPGEQHLLALRDLRIEIASPAFARFRRARQRLLFSVLLCCLGHQSSPPLAKTRKALVASPGASASRPSAKASAPAGPSRSGPSARLSCPRLPTRKSPE